VVQVIVIKGVLHCFTVLFLMCKNKVTKRFACVSNISIVIIVIFDYSFGSKNKMEKNTLILKKHLLAMKLLGIPSKTLASLSNSSVATITRKVKLRINEAGELDENCPVSAFIEERKSLVKRVDFLDVEDIEKKIKSLLNTDSYHHSSLVWLGNIALEENKNASEPYQRIFCPRSPDIKADYKDKKKAKYKWEDKHAVPANNRINDRLANMKLVLQLLNWDKDNVSTFVNDLKLEEKIDYPDISIADDNTYKLVRAAPKYNSTKHKEKRLLTSFIIKHLERDPNNFVYIQDFETNQKPDKFIGDKKSAHDSWWVYGHRDILDWFECCKINL